jgi:excisionase family DNA binding protein
MSQLNIRQFAERVGVHATTVRRWERNGKITPERTHGGHRRFTELDVAKALRIQVATPLKRAVIYCRVSSVNQKDDLKSQVTAMQSFALARGYAAETITEIGGGMNMSRKKFMQLVLGIISGEIGTIVVAHKDRLARFGFELIHNLADEYGCEIVVANQEQLSPQAEMVEDLMSIIHTFSCRLYGLRKYKKPSDIGME